MLSKLKEIKIDIIVAITRGGMIPACILSQLLDIREIDAINIEHYNETRIAKLQPFIFPKRYDHINSTKVLLVDDLVDSGKTMQQAIKYLEQFKPQQINTFTVFKKQKSEFTPDFYLKEIENDWIHFDFEKVQELEEMFEFVKFNS